MSNNIWLGIDPGFDRLGWAVGDTVGGKLNVLRFGTKTTNKKTTVYQRYQEIIYHIQSLITQFHPSELAIETVFFSNNKTTAMRISETRGLILGQCLAAGLRVFEYNPSQIKLVAAGSGNADKQTMAKMVVLQTNLSLHDTLDDAVDAVAVLITHSVLRNSLL